MTSLARSPSPFRSGTPAPLAAPLTYPNATAVHTAAASYQSLGPNSPQRTALGDPTLSGVKPHESFLIQKRSSGHKSIYGTDVENPAILRVQAAAVAAGTIVERPFTKANPAPASRATLPDPLPFNGNSTALIGMEDVVQSPHKGDQTGHSSFFSRKLQRDMVTSQALDIQLSKGSTRFAESRDNASKGHGGAAGLMCLQQAPGVHQFEFEERPKPEGFVEYPHPTHPKKCAKAPRAPQKLKLSATVPESSYEIEYKVPDMATCRAPIDLSLTSSTADIQAGTAKAMPVERIPGYMGHVPAHPSNAATLMREGDLLRGHTKDNLLITSHNQMPGYSGFYPTSIFNDKGRPMAPDLSLTTTGKFAKHVLEDKTERGMNTRMHSKCHAMKTLFSRGHSGEDIVIAETYYTKYRPYEGMMKHGAVSDQKWISDTQLKRVQQ